MRPFSRPLLPCLLPRPLWGVVVLLAALLAGGTAAAVPVAGLYRAVVPVAGQGPEERRDGIRAALEEVLVRVTGRAEAPRDPRAAPLLEAAGRFVEGYRFLPADGRPGAEGLPLGMQRLEVRFQREPLEQALYRAGLPVWGRDRPAVLLWLAVRTPRGRELVGGEPQPAVQQALREAARRRGLPLMLPLLDLEDRARLSEAEVWAGFAEPALAAAERYAPGAVALGRLEPGGPGWTGRWSLYLGGQPLDQGRVEARAAEEAAAALAEALAEALARRYALVLSPGERDRALLRVEGVHDLAAYARTLRYLESLEPVAGVRLRRVDGEGLTLELRLRTDRQGLRQVLALGEVLEPLPEGTAGGSADDAALRYRLRPAP